MGYSRVWPSPSFFWDPFGREISLTCWWLNQPIWKICNRQIGSFPPGIRGENKKYLSCHDLVKQTGYGIWVNQLLLLGKCSSHLKNDRNPYTNRYSLTPTIEWGWWVYPLYGNNGSFRPDRTYGFPNRGNRVDGSTADGWGFIGTPSQKNLSSQLPCRYCWWKKSG